MMSDDVVHSRLAGVAPAHLKKAVVRPEIGSFDKCRIVPATLEPLVLAVQ